MAFKKQLRVEPYVPDRTESLGDNTGQFATADIGKAVKQNAGGYLELCASGDEIFGFVTAVEPYTQDGHTIGSVNQDVNRQAWATDEAGGLAYGDNVVAGAVTALGTIEANGSNVIARAVPAVGDMHIWTVVETFGAAIGDQVLLQKV